MTLPPITDTIPERMLPLVTALRDAGFRTFACSLGDGENVHQVPTVCIEGEGADWTHVIARALTGWCINHNIEAVACSCYSTIETERWAYVRLEVYGSLRESY